MAFYNVTSLTQKITTFWEGGKTLLWAGCDPVIDSDIKIISGAYGGCLSLTSIEIPWHVHTLGYSTFGDSGLTSIYIPDTVKELGSWVLANVPDLTTIHFGPSPQILKIPDYFVRGSLSLTYVVIPDSVTEIGYAAFYQTSITSIDLPNYLKIIDDHAFSKTKLQSITIPENVNSLGIWMLANNPDMHTVVLGNGIDEIPYSFVYNCPSLRNINIPDTVNLIGGWSFAKTGLQAINIPNSVFEIGISSFKETGLTGVIIPNSVRTIGSSSFYNLPALDTVIIGNGVKTIGGWAFFDCPSLKYLTLGNNVKTIGYAAFYKNSIEDLVIPDSVTEIGGHAFRNLLKLEFLTLGKNIETIGDNALAIEQTEDMFKPPITSISIPDRVKSIGDWAFSGLKNVENLHLGFSVESIGSSAFNQIGISTLSVPKSVATIGLNAFYNATKLVKVTFFNESIVLDENAFQRSNNIAQVCGIDFSGTVDPRPLNVGFVDQHVQPYCNEPSCSGATWDDGDNTTVRYCESHVTQELNRIFPSVPARNLNTRYCHPGAYCNHVDNICKFTKNSIKCAWDEWKCSGNDICGQHPVCWELQNKFKDLTWAGLSYARCELESCYKPNNVCCEALTSSCEACKRCMSEEEYCLLPTSIRQKEDGTIPPGCTCAPGTYSEAGDSFSPCLPCIVGEGNTGGNDPCAACPAGSVNPTAGIPCVECVYPRYQPQTGMTTCILGTQLTCDVGQSWTRPSTTAEGSCTDCGPGSYAPTTTTEGCIPCPAGQHQADSKQASCTRCADDTTSVPSSDGDEDCTACTVDQDCRVRATINGGECKRESPDNLGCRSKTEAKDEKNWCETVDGSEDYCIVACPPGYEPILNLNIGTEFYECSLCAAGKASPGYDSEECALCPTGNYTTDGSECTACTMAGVDTWFNTFTGFKSDSECTASICDAGYKRVGSNCEACPGGEWSAVDSTECTADTIDLNDCTGNQHFVEGTDNTVDDAGCTDDDVQQSDCVAGEYYSAGENNVANDSTCENCTATQHSSAGAAACTDDAISSSGDCSTGTFYVPSTDRTADDGACTTCTEPTAAQYVTTVCSTSADTVFGTCTTPATDGSNYVSTICSKGSSTTTGSDTVRTDCSGCAAGKHIASGDACAGGTVNIAGNDDVCTNCAAGEYQDGTDQTSCKDCTAGTSYSTAGASSCTTCTGATDEKYVSTACIVTADTVFGSCVSASTGQYQSTACSKGDASTTGSAGVATSCSGNCAAGKKQTACDQGDWETVGGDRSCANCGANTYSASGATSCTNCDANTESTAGSATCTNCAAGKASTTGMTGSACSNCAAGTYSSAGDASCTSCADGTYSASGATTCSDHATCSGTKYASTAGTATADTTCTECTGACSGNTYESTACSATTNRVCSTCASACVSQCQGGNTACNYESTPCSASANRVCSHCCTDGSSYTEGNCFAHGTWTSSCRL
jgi:hypothetical protein